MKKHITFALLIMLTMGILPAKAQIGRFYSTDRELSNSLINHVYQDKRGFIWISTEDGLNKFDGNRFTIYKQQSNNPTGLSMSYVKSVFEDSQNRFWVSCLNAIQLYDRATDTFRTIPFHLKQGITPPHTSGIVERKNKEIWISTLGQGIMRLEGDTFVPMDKLNTLIDSYFIEGIYEDREQRMWICTENKGLFMYTPANNSIRQFNAREHLTSDAVSGFCEDKTGRLFISTLNGGLMRLDRETMTFEAIPYHGKTDLNIKTIMVDSRNTLYIGTEGDGIKQYDRESNRIVDCPINIGVFDLTSSKVHSILEDKEGNLWLGIFQKGLAYVPSMQNNFNYWGYKSYNKNNIGSNCVMSIFRDREGTIWVGTDNDGLYAVDEEGNRLAHYKDQGNNNSAPLNIMSVLEDSRRQLWVGSYFSGLSIIDKQTGRSRQVNALSGVEEKGRNERIFCLYEDRNKNIWVGTYGSGIYKMSLSQEVLAQYKSNKTENDNWDTDQLCNDWVNCIIQDNEGLIWIGTCNGLSCLDPEKNTFINFKDKNNLLPRLFIHTLLQDENGLIWIGTSEGLFRFNKATEEFTLYVKEDGLPSNVICGILEDNAGNLWISTHGGIAKLLTKTNTFVNYYASDGLQGNEFTRGACFRDRRGKLYFGGTSGISSFFPQEITTRKKTLKVMITDFMVANHSVRKGDKSGNQVITDTLVMDASQFTLAYNHSSFTVEFSTMEFSSSEKISYLYKLEGLDSDWMMTNPGVNRVTYTGLQPRKYTFMVQAKDNENLSDIRKFTILITPPWYQTTWALLMWALIMCVIIYAIIMYLLSRIRHRQEWIERKHEEEISEAKLQFFINISHEIRTPMTLIIGPLEKLIAQADRELQPTYLMIYRNAQRILRLINQLMDIRKLDKGQMHLKFRKTDLVGFVEDLMQTFDYQAQEKNIRFTFEHRDSECKAWVDLNNFDKVLLNVLSNAFKYTPNDGEITVSLSSGVNEKVRGPLKNYVEITVTDNGIGIDQNEIEQIFERFYQINNDYTKANFGTGIGLHLSRSLVELHHGTIKAENREDTSGTRFIIRLPLGSDHLKAEDLENPDEAAENAISIEKKGLDPHLLNVTAQDTGKKVRVKTKYRIVVVEDDDDIRSYITNELSSEFHIRECTNGKEALDLIMREKFDLIISDIMMPEMDGITLCKKVKQNINIKHIPVVLLTAKSKVEDRIEGLETGADGYLVKPFNTEILRTTVFNLIENRERLKSQQSSEQIMEDKVAKIERKSNDELLMDRIMKVINERLSDSTLNVETLAASVGMSRVHMHRKMKEMTNQSTKDFIRNIRLKQAGKLLIENNLTVSEAAYATGFTNISHFSTSFKDFYGVSPSEYKETKSKPD